MFISSLETPWLVFIELHFIHSLCTWGHTINFSAQRVSQEWYDCSSSPQSLNALHHLLSYSQARGPGWRIVLYLQTKACHVADQIVVALPLSWLSTCLFDLRHSSTVKSYCENGIFFCSRASSYAYEELYVLTQVTKHKYLLLLLSPALQSNDRGERAGWSPFNLYTLVLFSRLLCVYPCADSRRTIASQSCLRE